MAEAEAGIHGVPVETIHFHELGAVDTIVDVTGALLALEGLGVGRVVSSPVPLGRGMARSAHGAMPLPPPATVALLRGAKVVGVDHAVETVTPTAAALLAELAEDFGPIPPMQLTAVGYGAGTRLTPEPNVLRVLLGESAAGGRGTETLVMLETNIDDMSPEVHGYVIERLLGAGALDAYLTPVLMKKGPAGGRHQRPLPAGRCAPTARPALRRDDDVGDPHHRGPARLFAAGDENGRHTLRRDTGQSGTLGGGRKGRSRI